MAIVAPGPWRLVYTNSVLTEWLGETASQFGGVPLDAFVRTVPASRFMDEIERVWRGETNELNLSARLLSGRMSQREMPVEIRLAPVELGNQKCVGLVMQRAAESSNDAGFARRRDSLTGLLDRSELLTRLGKLLAGDRLGDHRFAVLFIDLDDFKQVNDLYGHVVGDRVLCEVAHRLAQCIRAGDQIVRYGGDEFVVLVEQVAGWEEYEPLIARIHAALAEPIRLPSGDLTISASVGAAEVAVEHRTPEDLLAAADRAMYAAKRRSVSRVAVTL